MVAARKTQSPIVRDRALSLLKPANQNMISRNLRKSDLGGVIFGAKNSTMSECLSKQLFGLPAPHFSYVKNIDPGLPLFLFDYSDRKLHGIFEAASSGQMNINTYGWTNGSVKTPYPAQVRICIRMRCQALSEDQFKQIIIDNYYTQNHFWFELDHAQTDRLIHFFSSSSFSPSASVPLTVPKCKILYRALPTRNTRQESADFEPSDSETDFAHMDQSNMERRSSSTHSSLDGQIQLVEAQTDVEPVGNIEEELLYQKLKEIVSNRENSSSSLRENEEDAAIHPVTNDLNSENDFFTDPPLVLKEKDEETDLSSSDLLSVVSQLTEEMKELKAFRLEQTKRNSFLEQKLAESEAEIQQLKGRCKMLESISNPSKACFDETTIDSADIDFSNADDLIYLVGGYDGVSWLSALDSYSPSRDLMKSLRPMSSIRSYASAAKLNGELYIFGGGNGNSWYDTVESYNPISNRWTSRPSLNAQKGSLAGATLNNKIFAIGGGNGFECFSEVEMFDPIVGRWISTRSMLQKRFAPAAAELNGMLYVVGGYDGDDYLKSAERFDPREYSWTRLGSMNTQRGCHSLAVLNEKLYALGGYDGTKMVHSVEVFEPRVGSWMTVDPMNHSRGYAAAPVIGKSIYVIGGVKHGENIVDTVESYNEAGGWQITNLKAIGKRCFFSAMVL